MNAQVEKNNPQIDKYIKPIIKSYLTSVSQNEYGLSKLNISRINAYLNTCDLDSMKGISELYQQLRKASWNKDIELMDFLIRCIEERVGTIIVKN